jgi:hypothetical protein
MPFLISRCLSIHHKSFLVWTSPLTLRLPHSKVLLNGNDAILNTTSKDPLRVSIRSILSPKIKWIQDKFDGLSQESWVKKVQNYQFEPLCTFQVINSTTGRFFMWFYLDWKLDICTFLTIYSRPANSFRWERITCLKFGQLLYINKIQFFLSKLLLLLLLCWDKE